MKRIVGIVTLTVLSLVTIADGDSADDVGRSGKELYQRYCSSCHGKAGQGDGPVASSLNVEVPDLTRYARRHGDFFDRGMIERIIDGRHVVGAHGTRMMPIWGEDLSRAQLGDPDAERAARIEIVRLADYVWQLQRPTVPEGEQR